MTGKHELEIMAEKLSAGFLADNVLMIIYKIRNNIAPKKYDYDKEFLLELLEFFECLSEYSDKDAFALAVEAPLRYSASDIARILEPYISISDIKNKVPQLAKEVKNLLEGNTDVDLLEDYFKRISEFTTYKRE